MGRFVEFTRYPEVGAFCLHPGQCDPALSRDALAGLPTVDRLSLYYYSSIYGLAAMPESNPRLFPSLQRALEKLLPSLHA
jgi:hypothetical protein